MKLARNNITREPSARTPQSVKVLSPRADERKCAISPYIMHVLGATRRAALLAPHFLLGRFSQGGLAYH
jgi:hypothetical protein